MIIYTDNTESADKFLPRDNLAWNPIGNTVDHDVIPLIYRLFENKPVHSTIIRSDSSFGHLFIARHSSESQYDILIDLRRENISLPHGVICLAERGDRFHGYKGRRWESPPGNIYLSVYFAPRKPVENFRFGFTVLAAVTVIDVIDRLPGFEGRAGIKWVNDILVEGSKVCGVLAYTISEGDLLTGAVIGIGLNVNTTPKIESTPFVPSAGSLRDFSPDNREIPLEIVLEYMIESLDENYRILEQGDVGQLLELYRKRSLIIGREVVVCEDNPGPEIVETVSGVVAAIGDHLELYLEGETKPVTRGRLIMK